MVARKTGQTAEKLALALGIHPLPGFQLKVKPTRLGRQPDFMQRLLQINNDLTLVWKNECDHASYPLIVDVCQGGVVDVVTAALNGFQQRFGLVKKIGVVHYNFTMLFYLRSLITAGCLGACAVFLVACGQRGPLYLPVNTAPAVTSAPMGPVAESRRPATDASKPL